MVRSLRVTCALLLSVVAVSSCGGQQPAQPKPRLPRATPAPPFKDRIEKVSRQAILNYARQLVFDSARTVGDQQRLMLGKCPDSCRYGPLVEVHAELGAAALTVKDLQSGRIIGRFVNRSAEPYEKLAIPASQESFVWVDYVEGKWRAYVVPTDPRIPITPRSAAVDEYHKDTHWLQSAARWKWHEDDETAWFTCTVAGCCKIDP